jgi:hypothetical protein
MAVITSKADLLPAERRTAKRKRALKSGQLRFGGFSPTVVDCLIVEMSDNGARVETGAMTKIPEILSLHVDNIDRQVRRAWAIGDQIGLEFLPVAV